MSIMPFAPTYFLHFAVILTDFTILSMVIVTFSTLDGMLAEICSGPDRLGFVMVGSKNVCTLLKAYT